VSDPMAPPAAQVQQALGRERVERHTALGSRFGVLFRQLQTTWAALVADEADGALPASGVQVLKDLSSGGTDEGRAMGSQIVHDIAPGASLAFLQPPSTAASRTLPTASSRLAGRRLQGHLR